MTFLPITVHPVSAEEREQNRQLLVKLVEQAGLASVLTTLAGLCEEKAAALEDAGRMVRSDRCYRVATELDSLSAYLQE